MVDLNEVLTCSSSCDFVLFSIPIAMIAILQLPKGRKIVLSLVMLPGMLVIGYVDVFKSCLFSY